VGRWAAWCSAGGRIVVAEHDNGGREEDEVRGDDDRVYLDQGGVEESAAVPVRAALPPRRQRAQQDARLVDDGIVRLVRVRFDLNVPPIPEIGPKAKHPYAGAKQEPHDQRREEDVPEGRHVRVASKKGLRGHPKHGPGGERAHTQTAATRCATGSGATR